jgi:opacity protein-like surface antigen
MSVLASSSLFAAYPVGGYNYRPVVQNQQVQQYQPVVSQVPQIQQAQQVQQGYIPVNQVSRMPQAVAPGRVTGTLPKVGNAYVAAGRKYYQPEGFDRLADSGLYVGLSFGYTYSVNGGMFAEYSSQDKSWFVPGAFQTATFTHNTVLPIQISVGAAINNDIRVDFSYLRYSGMSYPGTVQTSDGGGGFINATVTDGRVSSTATMLNLYYNLDSYTGVLASGSLRPYLGIGLGISTNTISDYLVYDKSFYPEPGVYEGDIPPMGTWTATSDIYAYHSGGTAEQLAYAFEGGVTTELEGGLKLDFFARWANMGRVESSGSIVLTQTQWLATGAMPIGQDGSEQPADYKDVLHYTDWKEGGKLTTLDLGIRLRIQF